ncbi:hypothetical protein GLV89_06665 [Halomonas alkaliantarctica]|nr:hypothetical protein [Halomonas alkaliantarctica]
MTPMKKPLSRSLLGVITLALTATAGAHSGHAPTEVHSHLGSPVIWLLLGAGVLGVTAVALLARRAWRKRQEGIKQVRAKSRV